MNPGATPGQANASMFQFGIADSIPANGHGSPVSAGDVMPFPALLGALLPASEEEISGSLAGTSVEDKAGTDEDAEDEQTTCGLCGPLMTRVPVTETVAALPWFSGLDLSLHAPSTETGSGDASGAKESGSRHIATLADERVEQLNPRLPDILQRSLSSPPLLHTSFAARLIAKDQKTETAVTPPEPAIHEPDAGIMPVRFGTAGSSVLNDSQRHAPGVGAARGEPGKNASTQSDEVALADPKSSENWASPPEPQAGRSAKTADAKAEGPERNAGAKHSHLETPVAGELHPAPTVGTVMTSATPGNIRVTEGHSGQAAATPRASETTPPSPAPQIAEPPGSAATAPLRDLAIDLPAAPGGDGHDRLQLQLTDRGGELRVRVRTSDPSLSGLLQRDLGDLVARLEDSGFDAQTWTPESTPSLAATAEARMGSHAENGQDRDPGSGAHSHNPRDGREDGANGSLTEDSGQRQHKNRAPSWLDEWDGAGTEAAQILRRR